MTKLTEDMIIARTKSSDLSAVKKLNCWGSDLDDISLVKRLSNVEVLSLSLNKIKSLADFQHCRNLVELYVRRNEIRDLSELCYLQELPRLKRLLLAENPCVESAGSAYRHTVLRCLPHLEVLDNAQVSQDEVDQAFKLGLILEHPTERTSPEPVYYREESPPAPVPQAVRRNSNQYDYNEEDETAFRRSSTISHSPPADYYYQNQNRGDRSRSRTPEPSPVIQLTNNTNNGPVNTTTTNANGNNPSPPTQSPANRSTATSVGSAGSGTGGGSSPQWEEQSSSSPTNNNGDVPQSARRTTHSPDYYRGSDREVNGGGTTAYHQQRRASTDYAEIYDEPSQHQLQNQRNAMPHLVHSTSTPRVNSQQHLRNKPRTKQSSNLLSAVLCLIPELDWQSLEVVELAVRRRMDEMLSD